MRSMKRYGRGKPAALGLAAIAAGALALAPASAGADAFGQIASWGSPGTAANQFFKPTELGVDTSDGSVYVIDRTSDQTAYRLQKFSASGVPLASVQIPRTVDVDGHLPVPMGVAVDPALHRVYVLQFRRGLDTVTDAPAAEQIDVFSTQESGAALHVPGDVPSGTLPVPDPTSSSALDDPRAMAVDPTTSDVLVVAYDQSGNIVIQRIGSNGTAGARYVDASGTTPFSDDGLYGSIVGLAVGPDGSVYVSKGSTQHAVYVYKLPPALNSVTPVLEGDVGPSAVEHWNVLGALAAGAVGAAAAGGGSQLAISPDGTTLYWTEQVGLEDSENPGIYTARGYSLATGATTVLYGGGTGSCEITTLGSSLAPGPNGVLYILDHGNYDQDPPTYGAKVTEFGPGGTGCPAPVASFTVGGSGDDPATVQKGSTVTFDAGGSELHGASSSELDWDFDGSGTFADAVVGSPAATTIDHKFLQAGTVTVGLRMSVAGSSFGDPPIVTKTVHVVPGTPTAAFGASSSSPTAGATVTFDASQSVDPTGSPSAGPTHTLKTYTWSFGDGSAQQQTSTPTVDHAFTNATTAAVQRNVTLTVTSNDDATSAPVSHQLSVQGTPSTGGDGGGGGGGQTPPPILPLGIASLMSGKLQDASTAGLTIGCAKAPATCTGTVALTASVKVKKGKKVKTQTIGVGSATFKLLVGQHASIKVKLSAKAKAILRTVHKLKTTILVTTRNADGATASTKRTLTLVMPVKAKGRKHKAHR